MKIRFYIEIVLLVPILFFNTNSIYAQNMAQVKSDLNVLTSKKYWGRGYTKSGMKKSALFLANRLAKIGVTPLNKGKYLQEVKTSVNTFPGKMKVAINNKLLSPGVEYIVGEESSGLKGTFTLKKNDSVTWTSVSQKKEESSILVVRAEKKLTWSVSTTQEKYTLIKILKDSIKNNLENISVCIDNRLEKEFKMNNVMGFIRGKSSPDTFIVFSAHYDHLGGMGKDIYFPGANDNASGVCMLLQLAEFYKKNTPDYSVAFIFFCGEEAGLLGSKFYTENPVFPLSKIKFLINLDLLGTGDEGITVVNATVFPKEYEKLKSINEKEGYLSSIKPRGKAANSDHYWFTEKGVPSFFIYTLGGIKAYHDIYDRAETLPLSKYRGIFNLLKTFHLELKKN